MKKKECLIQWVYETIEKQNVATLTLVHKFGSMFNQNL